MRLVLAAACGLAWGAALVACVGDSPDTTSTTDAGGVPDVGGGTDSGGTPPSDAGADGSIADTGAPCFDSGPMVFPPALGRGPFCRMAGPDGGNHCNFGDHCCITAGAADTCASNCPGTSVDMACFNPAECAQDGGPDGGPLFCCGVGALDNATCSYPQISAFTGSHCQASCSGGAITLCSGNGDCGALKCVGAKTSAPGTTTGICR